MNAKEVFKKLDENTLNVSSEAVRVLSKIADNILNCPHNLKLRTLQKNNAVISNKILSAKGGVECLKLMGFEENNTSYIMPYTAPLDVIRDFKTAVEIWKNRNQKKEVIAQSQDTTNESSAVDNRDGNQAEEYIRRVALPHLILTYTNPFLRRVETYAHAALQYENKELQERAKRLVPSQVLEEKAQKKLRVLQEHIKKNKLEDPEISVQDMLVLELLQWFKNDFFEWVDSPPCSSCEEQTSFSHMSTNAKMLVYTDRVELHRCKICNQLTPFPRYNDLNILLETRKGRCGEWANTFTLFCRAMGWDSRFVVEEGDHVWTEVYSITQKRWLHCDPCENICDTPLIYETGWHKKISYVIAYSAEEVQDVTWRYSSNHKEVLTRRKNCSEIELIDALFIIRIKQQKSLSDMRKQYLIKRALNELVELMNERKPTDNEQKGRSSGAMIWRMARGEIEETNNSSYVWIINSNDINNDSVTIQYSPSLNKYECISGNKIKEINNWSQGTYKHYGVFRKEENDWKKVYIARKEGAESGKICWKINLEHSNKSLDSVNLFFDYVTFENGLVNVVISSENTNISLPNGEKMGLFKEFSGSKELLVTATISGGKGDVAWQHAQLFRQSTDSDDYNFRLTLTFK